MTTSRVTTCSVCLVLLLSLPAAAQTVSGRGSTWAPYRPAQVPELPAEETAIADSTVMYPGPEYGEVISDDELNSLRVVPPGTYYAPSPAQSIMVDPATGNPFAVNTTGSSWQWQLLPANVIWHSYWAGPKEPRIGANVFEDFNGSVTDLDVTLGGRASVLRYGSTVDDQPCGWELQLEGAGMPRLNLDENWDLDSTDFRFGVPIVYGDDFLQFKLAYYHLSSHMGDEYILRTGVPASSRINYARDEIVLGASIFPLPAWRWYGEVGWAFYANEGADPWEFQFGVDYAQPCPTGMLGTPFFAVNGLLRQEVNFGGTLTAQAGWLWRGNSGRVLRTGLHYQNGNTNQLEFSREFEHQLGAGLWYDF